MDKEIYNRLDRLSPGFLRKDVSKYAKANNLYTEALQSFTDVELLKLKVAQLYGLPEIRKRILQKRKRVTEKSLQRRTIGIEFLDIHDPNSNQKYSNAR